MGGCVFLCTDQNKRSLYPHCAVIHHEFVGRLKDVQLVTILVSLTNGQISVIIDCSSLDFRRAVLQHALHLAIQAALSRANRLSSRPVMKNLLQQADHRVLPVVDILDNLSRSCGQASIAPQ